MSVEIGLGIASLVLSALSFIVMVSTTLKVEEFEHDADEAFDEAGGELGDHEARIERLEEVAGLEHVAGMSEHSTEIADDWKPYHSGSVAEDDTLPEFPEVSNGN